MAGSKFQSCCVVVADGARARFFYAAPPTRGRPGSRMTFEERADLTNPGQQHPGMTGVVSGVDRHRAGAGGAGRNDDASEFNRRREEDRRFSVAIIDKAAECCASWETPTVVLVADKHTQGQLRQHTHGLTGLTIRELSRDLSGLTLPQLQVHLADAGLLPGSPARPHAAH